MRKLTLFSALLILAAPAFAGAGWLHPDAYADGTNSLGNTIYCVTDGGTGTEICLNNVDAPGIGFNDSAALAGVGGNTGTTVGENRINAYMESFRIWAGVLTSTETIWVQGTFQPLACSSTGGVLGAAGTIQIFANFDDDGGPSWPFTWYHSALANKLADEDLGPGGPDPALLAAPFADDIVSFFNGALGDTGCLDGLAWYYGYDGLEGPLDIDFLQVLTHEVNHGLGFANFVDEGCIDYDAGNASGCQPPGSMPNGWPDIYTVFSWDNVFGTHWNQMNDLYRQYSSVLDSLVWDGPNVYAAAPGILNAPAIVRAAAPLSADYTALAATYTPYPPDDASITAEVVLWTDAADGTGDPHDACIELGQGPPSDAPLCDPAVVGKIALINRGSCAFVIKSFAAEACGAIGTILTNVVDNVPFPPGGSALIPHGTPTVMISGDDGDLFKANPGTIGTIRQDTALGYVGADAAGFPMLYAPYPVSPGSSISHWHDTASPNLLMEPFINTDLDVGTTLDLSPAQLADIGWDGSVHCPVHSDDTPGNVMIDSCDTGVDNAYGPWTLPGGLAGPRGKGWKQVGSTTNGGCYIADMVNSCEAIALNHGDYVACVGGVANGLRKIGAISKGESDGLKDCAEASTLP